MVGDSLLVVWMLFWLQYMILQQSCGVDHGECRQAKNLKNLLMDVHGRGLIIWMIRQCLDM